MNPQFRRRDLAKLYLFFFSFSGLYQGLVFAAGMTNSVGMREAVLMSTLWLIPCLLWPDHTKRITAILGLVLWSTSLVSLGYFYVFGQDFSQSVLFIIFESNMRESLEFLESYYDPILIGLMLLYGCTMWLFWRTLKPVYLSRIPRMATSFVIAIALVWPLLSSLVIHQSGWDRSVKHLQDRIEPAAPWHLIAGYFKYEKIRTRMQEQLDLNSSIPPLAGLHNDNPMTQPTLVLVIGESTNRSRMGLYGYPRSTTPRLNQLRDELLVFNDVISPRPYTIESLEQALTFADQTHPDDYLTRPTLINLMNQSGYQTHWITNQQTQTKRNTMLLSFSQQADQQIYLNNNRVQNSSQYDGEVLAPFSAALSNSPGPKFIVVHLLGTHRKYNYRYPNSFNHFTDRTGMPDWVPESHTQDYNDYDNAVLYNDYVVSELIRMLKQHASNSALVYFSDHGEEVYDHADRAFSGRNENAPTPAMYTVPFITWLSPAWSEQVDMNQLANALDRPYSLSDFIYSWADLAQIRFKSFDPTRSVFHPEFIPHKRWIGNPVQAKNLINYDQMFPDSQSPSYHVALNHP